MHVSLSTYSSMHEHMIGDAKMQKISDLNAMKSCENAKRKSAQGVKLWSVHACEIVL